MKESKIKKLLKTERSPILKKYKIKNLKATQTIILLVSIVLITYGWGIKALSNNESVLSWANMGNILLSIGCSVFAAVIVSIIYSKFVIEHDKVEHLIEEWGIEGIYKSRSNINSEANILLKNVHDSIDLIAFGLRGFRQEKSDELIKLAKNGIKIRILTIDPNSRFLVQREIEEGSKTGTIKDTISGNNGLLPWIDETNKLLNTKNAKKIKKATYDALPLDFYYRIDDTIYVGPYLNGRTSHGCITYKFKQQSKGFEYWDKYFDAMFNKYFEKIAC